MAGRGGSPRHWSPKPAGASCSSRQHREASRAQRGTERWSRPPIRGRTTGLRPAARTPAMRVLCLRLWSRSENSGSARQCREPGVPSRNDLRTLSPHNNASHIAVTVHTPNERVLPDVMGSIGFPSLSRARRCVITREKPILMSTSQNLKNNQTINSGGPARCLSLRVRICPGQSAIELGAGEGQLP